jgi:O-acetyl-ADP-ribose deacetylase (regulator of RNase III)
MSFIIVRQDITKMKVDAIVNAANTSLQMGGGVCGAIFKAAGAHELQAACDKLAPIKTGEAVLTSGFALPAKYIIHTAGPVYSRNNAKQCEQLLRSAYLNSLQLAIQHKCVSIAFPLISSGIYGYPKEEALKVATAAIQDFLADHDLEVYLAVFDKAAFVISEKLLGAVASYIDEHYVDEHEEKRRELLEVERAALAEAELTKEVDLIKEAGLIKEADLKSNKYQVAEAALANLPKPSAAVPRKGLDELIGNLDEPFTATLLRLIDAKGKTDVEVYKRANIDRKLFSKIRTGKGYLPSKRTIIALAVALELTLEETDDLLMRAGYALSHSQKFDVIVEYFIINGKYDIFEINEVLFKYDLPLLGG